MRHTVISGLATLALSSFSHTAVAQGDFYLFGAIGNANADVDLGVRFGGLRFRLDDDDSGFTLGGGYEFNANTSLEAAYQDLGTLTGPAGDCPPHSNCLAILMFPKVDAAALSVSFVGSFRIKDRLDGYGRLGLTSWEFDGSTSVFDDSGEDLHYGVGLRWSFDEDWKIFAEYTRVDLDFDAANVGIRYGL